MYPPHTYPTTMPHVSNLGITKWATSANVSFLVPSNGQCSPAVLLGSVPATHCGDTENARQ